MPRIIADLHIHSKFSRATSPDMEVEALNRWARMKGIDLLGTGDFTHPRYVALLKQKLEPTGRGLFRLKGNRDSIHFILSGEVSNIYADRGKTRRIHTLLFAPDFDTVDKINTVLSGWGKLQSDGRPIFGFPVKQLVEIVLGINPYCLIVPAHIWTPWFSLFGDQSGYDSVEEAFGEWAREIYAVETGLSSDPGMNWRLSQLDRMAIVSNSDAHSPAKLGREANVFDAEFDYQALLSILKTKDPNRFVKTIEFFPEEGKYHFDGHRTCNVLFDPAQTRASQGICPVCGKPLTIGVMHRVEELADRPAGYRPDPAVPFVRMVPLQEIVAEAMGIGVNTTGVEREYEQLVAKGGSEFRILLDLTAQELAAFVPERICEGIVRVREGKLTIRPGHDGVYGSISIFGEGDAGSAEQMALF